MFLFPPNLLPSCRYLLIDLFIFGFDVCAFVMAPPSLIPLCLFVFTERPKECVWWGDIGCTGASRAQEETQMCASMRCSSTHHPSSPMPPPPELTHFTLTCTHLDHTHTDIQIQSHIPQPCSAKADWQTAFTFSEGKDENESSATKFKLNLSDRKNIKQVLLPLPPTTAKRLPWPLLQGGSR